MIGLTALLLLLPAGEAVEQWRSEIQDKSGAQVVIARVMRDRERNTITLPSDTPEREVAKSYLQNEEFVRNLMDAHALLVSHRDAGGRFTYIVMLNMDRSAEWASEDSIIAHELGHAWLKAQGYPAPLLQEGPAMCLGIHTGNVVQHILIRKELDRRGIDHRSGWIRDLDLALVGMEKNPALPTEPCQRILLAATWLDVRLGLTAAEWPNFDRYERVMAARAAAMKPFVDQITVFLRGADVSDKAVHRKALEYVFVRLKLIGQGTELAGCPSCGRVTQR